MRAATADDGAIGGRPASDPFFPLSPPSIQRPAAGREKDEAVQPSRLTALAASGAALCQDGPTGMNTASWLLCRGAEHLATPTPASSSARRTPKPRRWRHPEHYLYDLNLADIAEVWRRGSVISSWLLDLAPALSWTARTWKVLRRVSDSGEGRWTIAAASTSRFGSVLSAALYERFSSRAKTTSPTSCSPRFVPVWRHKEKSTTEEKGSDGQLPFGRAVLFGVTGDLAHKKIFPRSMRW